MYTAAGCNNESAVDLLIANFRATGRYPDRYTSALNHAKSINVARKILAENAGIETYKLEEIIQNMSVLNSPIKHEIGKAMAKKLS